MARAIVGISGWRYPSWRGDFYPEGLPQRRELEFVGRHLDSVELNGSFYSLQRPESYRRWRSEVPADFVFAVKGGRFITHMKRLRGIRTPLANFFASGVLALGPTLGPVLWQLPERFEFDADVLAEFFDELPRTTLQARDLARQHDDKLDGRAFVETETDAPLRHCLEVRHPSFQTDAFTALLAAHDIGTVIADTAGRWPMIRAVTSDFVYVRLHGAEELYASGYDDDALDRWADDARGWLSGADGRDVYVYFDNDARGHAPFDAVRLRERLAVGWNGCDSS
ncbi:DUF72 domain-containing protein [Herbiconiux daphne]|uniref:DUF72 domain-containing protein n=1 Tax=Herbiconiux daphne TaxID=2970914 RepID=A0ABT2H294_9MICO|nr:DUF72 domain-containing protein [Herbiconiux daphne]MCS5734034.1 DUF72 domain-containing protein [Herbiconiux daphne]